MRQNQANWEANVGGQVCMCLLFAASCSSCAAHCEESSAKADTCTTPPPEARIRKLAPPPNTDMVERALRAGRVVQGDCGDLGMKPAVSYADNESVTYRADTGRALRQNREPTENFERRGAETR